MAMNSSPHNQNQYYPHPLFYSTSASFFSSIVVILLLQLLVIYPSATPRELLFEEKTRLGSRPPSCHNKCNQCHPCMAVQVPTLPVQTRVDSAQVEPGSDKKDELGLVDSSMAAESTYSNYKPLGWKCLCKDHFFNP